MASAEFKKPENPLIVIISFRFWSCNWRQYAEDAKSC
jgi:hypothetical protein